MNTPIGRLLLVGTEDALRRIEFERGKTSRGAQSGWKRSPAPFRAAVDQLRAYFAGELRDFDLPLDPRGTEFQRQTWGALRKVPYGDTATYAEIARRIGRPTAVRAVGAANGQNPIPIIIPCHRVIGSNGQLTGFGGGLDIKRQLLELEGARAVRDENQRLFA
jgi:methylated-DNA-[protein]-cysteine S-methyltransferase